MERLDKLLAATGQWSRKEAKALVKAGPGPGRGRPAQGTGGQGGRRHPRHSGWPAHCHGAGGLCDAPQARRGVSSTQDPRSRTVLDLLPQHLRRRALFPVGRLDKDTEGLLLLTNDGPLAHALLAPGRHVDKVYYVEVDGRLDQQDRRAFQAGVTLADGTVCQPGGPDGAGPAQPGLGDPPGGEVSPGQAHAGRPREACDLSQTPVHGAPDPGPGPSGRGLAAVDPGRKSQSWTIKGIISAFSTKIHEKAIEIARRNRYNIGYSMMPSWGILIFVRRNQEKPPFESKYEEEIDMSSRVFQSIVLQMKECTDRSSASSTTRAAVVSCNQLTWMR